MQLLTNPTLEELFLIWLDDLQLNGFISRIEIKNEIEPFVLYEKVIKQKTYLKKKPKERVLYGKITYKPDVVIVWTERARNIFFLDHKSWDYVDRNNNPYFKCYDRMVNGTRELVSYVEVKAPIGAMTKGSDVTFPIKRRILYDKTGIEIVKCMLMPVKKMSKATQTSFLFNATFTPERFFVTDKGTKYRKMPTDKLGKPKWSVRTLGEYVELFNRFNPEHKVLKEIVNFGYAPTPKKRKARK